MCLGSPAAPLHSGVGQKKVLRACISAVRAAEDESAAALAEKPQL